MKKGVITGGAICLAVSLSMFANTDLQLDILRFAEGRTVKFNMVPTARVPGARMKAEVKYEEGQERIEIEYDELKPAVLFGGDVTCYVLWAINRDGAAQNLGELWVRPDSDSEKVEFSTGLRNFALVVTAESYYQVGRPSDFVIFQNDGRADPPVPTDSLIFSSFASSARHGVENLSSLKYDGKKPLDLLQAEVVYRIASDLNASEYANELFAQATLALEQATLMYNRSVNKGVQRFARRSVAASNEAISLTLRKVELEELEAQIAERQAQMASLESRAKAAELRANEAEEGLAQARERSKELSRLASESEAQVAKATRSLEEVRTERAALEAALESLRAQQERLQASMQDLQVEKVDLQGKLQSALSQVADTRESARGLIVSLPDILFDVGEASLKPGASMALAKLAGILLIMDDLNLRIEGHTDSTGSPSFNLRLSQRRADAVFDLLSSQGIRSSRIRTVGYGMERPVADNSSAEGRSKNRRVEIIIAEGEISAG
jgi:outer membrane protein OmpA-like peptidoglycan-associated protein